MPRISQLKCNHIWWTFYYSRQSSDVMGISCKLCEKFIDVEDIAEYINKITCQQSSFIGATSICNSCKKEVTFTKEGWQHPTRNYRHSVIFGPLFAKELKLPIKERGKK